MRLTLGVGAGIAAILLLGTGSSAGRQPHALFADSFGHPRGPNNLITNEWALYNPGNPAAVRSSRWEMTSGSIFSRNGVGWSGSPDLAPPDATSSHGTGSAVFRLRTRRADFGNVRVAVDVRVLRWVRVRPEQQPAVVLWMRYVSPENLYWPAVLSADASVGISKKVPGGPHPVNGGTYYILPPYTSRPRWPVRLGRWYHLEATVRTRRGAVTITTYRDGRLMQRAVDRGPGQRIQASSTGDPVPNPSPPISGPARLGIRADNAAFELRDYRVYRLP